MYFDKKATCRYLRRRHKLYKAINNFLHDNSMVSATISEEQLMQINKSEVQQLRIGFASIFYHFLQENFDISEVLEKMKHSKKIIYRCSKQFLKNILLASELQSGHKLAYVIYRFCKQNPMFFKKFVEIFQQLLENSESESFHNLQKSILYTDLFLYGYCFTAKTFVEKIFIHVDKSMIDYVIRLPPISEWEVFLPKRYAYKLKSTSENLLLKLIKETKAHFQTLKHLKDKIQTYTVEEKSLKINENNRQQITNIEQEYLKIFQLYENTREKLVYLQRDENMPPAKELQFIKKECDYYEPSFRLPELLHKLYKERQVPKLEIKRVRNNQMTSIYDDEAFLAQFRICGSIQQAVDLASYFIANLSSDSNRQQLIEFVIDYCHNESNLDLMMRILTEINCAYPQLRDYLNKKAYRIASQIKMNKKYLSLMCEGIKYGLIDSFVMLDYVQKRIKSEHTEMNVLQTVRQCCHVLELLGQGIYHESLTTNITINQLFDLIQEKIKEKKLGIEFYFNLKCVKNYLRKPHLLPDIIQNSSIVRQSQTLSQLSDEFTLSQHFELILKRIKQLLSSKTNNKTEENYNKKRTINYIVGSIENQSNYITTFYEASLIKQLNNKQIRKQMVQKCIQKIQLTIGSDPQLSLRWSRFLGQLYNYEIINRKRLAQILQTKLLYCVQLINQQNFEHMVKSVLQCLNTSKSYILESETQKQTNQYIVNFLIKFKKSILRYIASKPINRRCFDNLIIENEVQEILQYFHSALLHKLKTQTEIDVFAQKVKFSSPKDTLLSVNLIKVLQYYLTVDNVTNFDPTFMDGSNNKGKQKIQSFNGKTKSNKKVVYMQKSALKPKQQPEKYQEKTCQTQQQTKKAISKILEIEQKIEEINEHFRNEETQQIPQSEKHLIKQEISNLQKNLKKMMGITPQIQDLEKFPELHPRNLKDTIKNKSLNNHLDPQVSVGNIKKILKNQNGKKIKIIAKHLNSKAL